jgi:hypothetical protein
MRTKLTMAILSICIGVGFVGCSRKPDDTAIADSIKARFFSDPKLKEEPIEITVTNGEATLLGDVSSDETRQRLLGLTQAVPGVTKVNDAMHIKPEALAESTPPPNEQPATNAPNSSSVPPPVVAAPVSPNTPAAAAKTPKAGTDTPAAAPGTQPPTPAAPPTPPPPPPPKKVVVPQGTAIQIVTIDAIDSDKSKIGTTFLASLAAPISVGGEVVAPAKSNVYMKLLDAKSAGKVKGKSELQVSVDSIEVQGKRYQLQTSVHAEEGKSKGKQTAKRVGIGAGVGTAIGAIAGGGKGAAIGAAVGAGGGLAVQALTKGDKVQVPSETKLEFTLDAPVEITIQPGKSAKPASN